MNTRNLGKQFEQKVRDNFKASFPQGYILRLADQQSGYLNTSSNPADFLGYNYPYLFLLEAKSIQTPSFPFSNLRQYEKLIQAAYLPGVRAGVVMWFVDLDLVWYVPIVTIKKMKDNQLKSLNPKKLDRDTYPVWPLPSVKLRTFMNSDYQLLMSIPSDQEIYPKELKR